MNNINWDGFRYFIAATKARSLSGAAKILGSNQSTVGRHIDTLEISLGVKLFERSVKGLVLTDAGQGVFDQVEMIQKSIINIQHVIQGADDVAQGTVRLSLPEGLGLEVLIPELNDFYQQYPDIKLIFNMSATTANLTQSDADVAVRLFQPDESDLSIKFLGEMKTGLYASKKFGERYGLPKKMKDLRQYNVITYGDHLSILPENQWLLNHTDKSKQVLRSDSTITRFKATTSGLGLSLQPQVLADTDASLIRLFKGVNLPSHKVWLVCQAEAKNVPRIRAVVDFISTRLSERLQVT